MTVKNARVAFVILWPFLTGALATALAKGIQSDDPRYWQAAALLKHFFAKSTRPPVAAVVSHT